MKHDRCTYCGSKQRASDSDCGMPFRCRTRTVRKAAHSERIEQVQMYKRLAHQAFDPLWQSGLMGRDAAYSWLAEQLGIPKKYTHIAMFGIGTCKRVIAICQSLAPKSPGEDINHG
jgi:hypothetical protein